MKEMEKALEKAIGWEMENRHGFCRAARLSTEAKIGSKAYDMIAYNGELVEEIEQSLCRLS